MDASNANVAAESKSQIQKKSLIVIGVVLVAFYVSMTITIKMDVFNDYLPDLAMKLVIPGFILGALTTIIVLTSWQMAVANIFSVTSAILVLMPVIDTFMSRYQQPTHNGLVMQGPVPLDAGEKMLFFLVAAGILSFAVFLSGFGARKVSEACANYAKKKLRYANLIMFLLIVVPSTIIVLKWK